TKGNSAQVVGSQWMDFAWPRASFPRQYEDGMGITPGRQDQGHQLEDRKKEHGEWVNPRPEEPVLDPGHQRRAQAPKAEPVHWLAAGLGQEGLELLEGITIADVPPVLGARYSDPVRTGLPVAVGCGDVDEAVLRG